MKEIVRDEAGVRIRLDDDLTSTKNVSFETEVISIINDESPKLVIIDLDEVKMVDSFGIRGLFSIHNAINQTEGKLRVINVSEDIYGLFKYMRMNTHFEVVKKK